MKTMSCVLLLMVCATLSAAECAKGMSDPKTLYPENDYLAAIGDGDTLSAAQSRAMTALSYIFEAKVKGDLTMAESSTIRNGKEETLSFVRDAANIRTEQQLINVQFGEHCTDKSGRIYVAAYLDRRKTAPLYVEKIQGLMGEAEQEIAKAKGENEPVKAFARLKKAVVKAQEAEVFKRALRIIHPPTFATLKTRPVSEVITLFEEQVRKLTVSLAVEGDKESRLKAAADGAFKKQGLSEIVEKDGALRVTVSFVPEKTELQNKYYNLRWTLTLTITDKAGKPLVTKTENQRTSAISESEALNRSYKDAEKALAKLVATAVAALGGN